MRALAFALCFQLTAEAPAAPPAPAPPPAENVTVTAPTERDRVRCRTEEVTGSRVRARRVCESQAERERRANDTRNAFRDGGRRGGPGQSDPMRGRAGSPGG